MSDAELRALDAEVHQKVFRQSVWFELNVTTGESRPFDGVPAYSTDIAAAFLVLAQWEGDFELRRQNGIAWKCELFKPSREWEEWAETLPLAICRAALKAVGAK